MKQILLFLLVSLMICCKKDKEANPGNVTSSLASPNYFTFDGRIGTMDNSSFISSDGNIIMCGSLQGSLLSALKVSKSGNIIWRNDYNAGSNSISNGITELNQ